MTSIHRRIALVCMTPASDANEHGDMNLPSFGIHRILAAVLGDRELKGVQLALIDVERPDVDAYVEAIEAFRPDIVGLSIYVWSTPCLVEVARRIKRRRPECLIVFGGPSARTALFDLPPYADRVQFLDAVVATEGENTFRNIARLPALSRGALASVAGLHVPTADGWTHTGERSQIMQLDELASPYQLGIMSERSVGYLETFRGCPFSCAFCEWGVTENSRAVFSADYIERELRALARLDSRAIFSVDAGLNLNHRAFRNLREAESRVGCLKQVSFWSEIYPSLMREEHLEFLSSVRAAYLGIGLQSTDPKVLKSLERPFDNRRLEKIVMQVRDLANAEVQIIFGLPGDTPEGFRRTFEYARSLSVAVRAYRCLVLPDALMTRSRPEWQVRFDPVTLALTSCDGWREKDVLGMRDWLTAQVARCGGKFGAYWWYFPRAH